MNEQMREAERALRAIPEYDWLSGSNQQFFTTAEVAGRIGLGVAAVRALCESGDLAGATFYTERIGWRIPRSGLVLYLASRLRQRGQSAG